jgi:hypothetical protein
MARELTGGKGGFPPSVKFLKEGDKFAGKLTGVRESNNGFGPQYSFEVIGGTAFIGSPDGTKNDKGFNNYKEVDVTPGTVVSLSTSTGGQLERSLSDAVNGDIVGVLYNGKKLNPKSGRRYNDFKVFVLEEKEVDKWLS